jgi:hypothetical protein
MEHLSKEDAVWLMEVYKPMRGNQINVENFQVFLKAYNLMKNTNRKMGCFTCEARQVTKITTSYFEQHEHAISLIAYPPATNTLISETKPKKKRGRKKKNV